MVKMKRILLSVSMLAMLLAGCEEGELEELGLSIEEVANEEVQEVQEEPAKVIEEIDTVSMEDKYYFLTSDDEAYLEAIKNLIDIHSETMSNVAHLVADAKENVSLAQDEDYIHSLKLAYVKSELSLKLLNKMSEIGGVPKFLKESHGLLVNSVEELIMTKQYFVEGLMKLDNSIVLKGVDHINESESYFYKFDDEIREATKNYK